MRNWEAGITPALGIPILLLLAFFPDFFSALDVPLFDLHNARCTSPRDISHSEFRAAVDQRAVDDSSKDARITRR